MSLLDTWEGYEIICIKDLLLGRGMINDCLCPACQKEREEKADA